MKRLFSLFLTVLLAVTAAGCNAIQPETEISNEEVVTAMLTAYQQGDYETMKQYTGEDNLLLLALEAAQKENATGLDKLYQQVYEQTKNFTFTAKAVEGKEAWGEVSVQLSANDITTSISSAMQAAIEEQVVNGGEAFVNYPDWLQQGIQEPGEPMTEELSVFVNGNTKVVDYDSNRKLFAVLSGNFYPYFNASMTVCTSADGSVIHLAALKDDVIAMLQADTEPFDGSAEDPDVQASFQEYAALFADLNGITGSARVEDGFLTTSLGVNFENASTAVLKELGIINDRISYSTGEYLSLATSVRSFEEAGMVCETVDFATAV